MKIDGLTYRLLKMKEAHKERDKSFQFGVVDNINEFKFTGRSVAVVIERESESQTKKSVDLTFYYAKARPKEGDAILGFRSEAKGFTDFISEFEDDDFYTDQFQIDYGVTEGVRGDFSIAAIKGNFDVTKLRDVDLSEGEIYEKMKDLYLTVEVVE